MQQKEQGTGQQPAGKDSSLNTNQMATNPNPRANENIEGTTIDKNTSNDETLDVGSEITDGEAS
jgi:hypothetical protein